MIAIIPARGGSKGLPGKNIKLLNGIPLIAHTINAALKSKAVTRVFVNTDDEEIAAIAKEYGAEVPFLRPIHLASDTARAIDVYAHFINKYHELYNIHLQSFIVLQPTSPLRSSIDIDAAITLFSTKNADSVISFCQEHHPVKWHKYITEDYKITPIFEDTLNNRQLEKPSFYPNGAIYVFNTNILKANTYYTENTYAYIMDRSKSIDIDFLEDFQYAEFLLSLNK